MPCQINYTFQTFLLKMSFPVRGYQSHQAGARRRLRHHPAGNFNDERLSPPKHCCLFRLIFEKRQTMDLHGILRRVVASRHLS
jgi:hypothetical protein